MITPSSVMPRAAASPYVRLLRAVGALEDQGERTPCQAQPDAFTGDPRGKSDHETAAALCLSCPLLQLCDEYATTAREGWHVWGGKARSFDRTT